MGLISITKEYISDIVCNIKDKPFLIKRWVKHRYQTIRYGYNDSETWSLYSTTAKFMLPRLKRFKELNCSYPVNLTPEEWDLILDELIWYLELLSTYDEPNNEAESIRYNKAKELFAQYFEHLWW